MSKLPPRLPGEPEWAYAAFHTFVTRTRAVEETVDVHGALVDRAVSDHPPAPIPAGAVRVTLTPGTKTVTIPGPEGATVVIGTNEPDRRALVMPRWAAGYLLEFFGYDVVDGASEAERANRRRDGADA